MSTTRLLHPGRRRWPLATAALLLLLVPVLAACGDDSGDDAAVGEQSADIATTAPDGGAFPVSIEHIFGTTEVEAEPQRVITLGYQEHDIAYALGVQPVAVRYWFGPEDDVIYPWADDEAGDSDPAILNMAFGSLAYEEIAALDPDLILAVYSGITEEEYGTLSEIAPTIAQPDGFTNFGVPWQDATRFAAAALGQTELAEQLIADVEAEFAAARAAHPEWEGLEVAVAAYRPGGSGTFASSDPRTRFFQALGFVVPDAIDELAGDQFYGTVSPERMDILDNDLLVWDQMSYVPGGQATIEADPLVAALGVMSDGHAIYMEGEVEAAFAFNSVLSQTVVLEAILPELEAVLG